MKSRRSRWRQNDWVQLHPLEAVRDGLGPVAACYAHVEVSRACSRRAGLAQITLRGVCGRRCVCYSTISPETEESAGWWEQIDCSDGLFAISA
jgi:hypothetical protein